MATRRGRGEGGITRRKDGRWMAQVDLGWQNGKRTRKSLYGRTRREVAEKLRETLYRTERGLPPVPAQETLGAFLTRWLEIAGGRLRPNTYERYSWLVRDFLVPHLGSLRLVKLTPDDVALCVRRVEESKGPYIARAVRETLSSALNQALRWELVLRNVVLLTDPPRVERREIAPLNVEQAQRLLRAAAGDRHECLLTVAVAVGLRHGEALGLGWEHVDLPAGLLSVRRTLLRGGPEPRFGEPKTMRSRRTINLPDAVVAALRRHRTRQLEARLAAGSRWRDHGLVFTTGIGTALDAGQVHRDFKQLLRRAELPDIRFHDLRHTAATLMLAQGIDVRTIMETLGHSSISMTLDTYAHVIPALQRGAAAKMEQVLWPSVDRG